jgi:hypothetical protein
MPDLTDDCLVRIATIAPPLNAESAAALVRALDKLFAQFAREARCQAWSITVEAGGAAVVMGWSGPALSGCSHDKINGVLTAQETATGAALLAAPPILAGDPPRALDRSRLKQAITQGAIDGSTPWFDVRAATLGAWRASPRPLRDSPFGLLLSAAASPG